MDSYVKLPFPIAKNPNDTEESIWYFLCSARLHGIDVARKQFLEVGRDSRPVMREAYNIFKNGGDPEKVLIKFGNDFSSGQASQYFYASLYAGLYYEAEGKSENAKFHVIAACGSPYGQRSNFGRRIVVVDETSRSKHAMMWALTHLTNKGDLMTLLHALSLVTTNLHALAYLIVILIVV